MIVRSTAQQGGGLLDTKVWRATLDSIAGLVIGLFSKGMNQRSEREK
jgi:hypothetical protein